MPRRAKTGLQSSHYIGIAVFIGIIALVGYALTGRKAETGYSGVSDLNVTEYLQNSNALSNNTYRFEGVIGERLDTSWSSDRGRLFSIMIEENGQTYFVPVLVPSQFNGTNMQRGERFRFKATVQAETGLLVTTEMAKT